MRVKRMCRFCGIAHTRIVSRVNYGPFMDWECYHCTGILPDEVGCDARRKILYFGSDNVSMRTATPAASSESSDRPSLPS